MGGFSILTNVASLQAQNYLTTNQAFQSKTIQEVTSGLRIVSSGDDAAGLAIANGFRSDEAVLTQGILNANNGVAQLQIMDGGMSNISQLLDRARTLATESASGTFTGSRSVLDNEYQSVLSEIDRQAQSVGLNQGGIFATNLSVFIGGGKGATAQGVINNGTVSVNLANATVDTQSLGLKGFTAGYQASPDQGLYDLSDGTSTSVASILAANSNPATTSFILSGPGFGSAAGANGPVTITVNLASVADPASLTTAINAGIAAAAQAGTPGGQALAAANVSAQIHTGSDGHQQLVFVSPDAAFNVAAGDVTSNALMGNMTGNTGGSASGITSDAGAAITGASSVFVAGGTQQSGAQTFTTMVAGDSQTLSFTANGPGGAAQNTVITLSGANTAAQAVAAINGALQATDNPALQGIVASADGAGATITFSSNNAANTFNVVIGQTTNAGATAATGFSNPNTTVTSHVVGVGATSSIATQAGAESAVSALANSVSTLGNAQAAVGRGENQFNYAINLAQSELTNETTAESDIRDANLATEAANLTKAQILLQAGVAALAQANAAPQNILALLKG
ncbi:MAG TPA: flagellin [Bryobacteraceae bacterium]|nr:flagellin [Bryobacteraceae bacterium]